jgi:hypothetical protein
MRRAALQDKQAMPQMPGTRALVPAQGLAQPQSLLPLPHRKEVMPQ